MDDQDDLNPWRHWEPLNLQVGDRVAIDGPIEFVVGKDAGRLRLMFAGVESTDVYVKTSDGKRRRLAKIDKRPPEGQ